MLEVAQQAEQLEVVQQAAQLVEVEVQSAQGQELYAVEAVEVDLAMTVQPTKLKHRLCC